MRLKILSIFCLFLFAAAGLYLIATSYEAKGPCEAAYCGATIDLGSLVFGVLALTAACVLLRRARRKGVLTIWYGDPEGSGRGMMYAIKWALFGVFVVPVIIAGLLISYGVIADYSDKATNYVEVRAKILNVSEYCLLYRISQREVIDLSDQFDDSCGEAERRLKYDPQFRNYSVKRNAVVKYSYQYPEDSLMHVDSYKTSWTEEVNNMNRGDEIAVLVDKTDPSKSRAK